jgi:hypothetical protein
MGVASVGLMIGSLLIVEIAQHRSGAPATFRRRASSGVARRARVLSPAVRSSLRSRLIFALRQLSPLAWRIVATTKVSSVPLWNRCDRPPRSRGTLAASLDSRAVTLTGGTTLRLSNAIAGLGAQLRDQSYYKNAVRMSRMARLLLVHGRNAASLKVGTELNGPLWKKKTKRYPARRSVYGLRSFSLLSPSGSLTFCSSRWLIGTVPKRKKGRAR